MKHTIVLPLAIAALTLLSSNAMAFQTGKIYVSKEGEWMCIDKWGNEIPASSSGGWTVVSPPRTVGGECNNRRAVLLDTNVQSAPPRSIDHLIAAPEPLGSATAQPINR